MRSDGFLVLVLFGSGGIALDFFFSCFCFLPEIVMPQRDFIFVRNAVGIDCKRISWSSALNFCFHTADLFLCWTCCSKLVVYSSNLRRIAPVHGIADVFAISSYY